jgi:hypothetical protein
MTYLLHALGCVCHVALLFLQQSNSDFLTLTCLLRSGKVSTETGGKVSTEIYSGQEIWESTDHQLGSR